MMQGRVAKLEDALREIVEIADVSEGPVARFYGMLAEKGLLGDGCEEHLEEALLDIEGIASVSNGPASRFYEMLAKNALKPEKK
jgi:hypothetical protein